MAYVKEYHTTGVQWNVKGIDTSEYKPCTDTVAPSSIPSVAKAVVSTQATIAPPTGNIFMELNKGGAITSGLKTVTKDMQTWRAEYKGGDAPAPAVKTPVPHKPATSQVKGPPKLEYQSHGAKVNEIIIYEY